MDSTTAFGVGVTSLGSTVIMIIAWIIARGIKSRCVVGGNVLAIDVHRQTQAERDIENPVPSVSTAPTPQPTIIEINTQPPLHPVRVPKIPRDSLQQPVRKSHTPKVET